MHNCAGRIEKVFTFAPAQEFENYFVARNNPKAVHYAGFEKPWNVPDADLQEHFWVYARHTPHYESLLERRQPVLLTVKDLNEKVERHQRLYHPILHIVSKFVRNLRESKQVDE